MAECYQKEKNPEWGFWDVPLIAAGTFSDALCCQSPHRDFATEKIFRLQNAAKMYPGGYFLVSPYAPEWRVEAPAAAAAPRWQQQQVSPVQAKEASAALWQKQAVVEPVYYAPYTMKVPRNASFRDYRWEEEETFIQPTREVAAPLTPKIESRPWTAADPVKPNWNWSWGASAPGQAYPLELGWAPAQPLRPWWETQQVGSGTSREIGGLLIPNWRGTGWEEMKAEEKKKVQQGEKKDWNKSEAAKDNVKNTEKWEEEEKRTKEEAGQTKNSWAKKGAPRKGGHHSKQNQDAKKEQEETKKEPVDTSAKQTGTGQEASPASQDESGRNKTEILEKKEEAETAETEKGDGDDKDASGERGKTKEEQKKEAAEEKAEEEEGSVVSASDGPTVPEETEGQWQWCPEKEIDMKIKAESMNQNGPPFPVNWSASAFADPRAQIPTPTKTVVSGLSVSPAHEGQPQSWWNEGFPVGYVPPADGRFKELVVGNEVYFEGGTFYLSETGAYLLGLRD